MGFETTMRDRKGTDSSFRGKEMDVSSVSSKEIFIYRDDYKLVKEVEKF